MTKPIIASTAEDVFYLYERQPEGLLLPFTIGDKRIPCSFKRKCYIKQGDECPICFDAIQTKRSAYITACGHSFHKACLSRYMESKWLSTKYTSNARCPMCRSNLGHPEFIQRYQASYFSFEEEHVSDSRETKSAKGLDRLEDFWISCDCKIPSFCSHGYDHFLGIDKHCFLCLSYREKGDVLYEL